VSVDLQYRAQSAPLTIPLSQYPATNESVAVLFTAFETEHRRTFGYVTGEILQSVAIKATAQGLSATPRTPKRITHGNTRTLQGQPARRAYFGAESGWHETAVIARADLDLKPRAGPLIVEEYDTTVIVRPGWTARLDEWNNIHMERA
jgi:N-methylhydantoinase A